MIIIGMVIGLLTAVGISLGFAHEAVSTSYTGTSENGSSFIEGSSQPSVSSAWSVLTYPWQVVTWTFGDIPFWARVIWVILLTILILTISRNIWVGGGG